uniref:C2H2-type domain-containing protein n=1 Tax=Timema poppense TaxID=170557 RepID=A0A7R9H560_TIMPO|nr:unnamed protein product [Timema poppensis]
MMVRAKVLYLWDKWKPHKTTDVGIEKKLLSEEEGEAFMNQIISTDDSADMAAVQMFGEVIGTEEAPLTCDGKKIFEWAQVVVSQTYLDSLPANSFKAKQVLLKEIAMSAKVEVELEEECVIIVGSWNAILKTQLREGPWTFGNLLGGISSLRKSTQLKVFAELAPIPPVFSNSVLFSRFREGASGGFALFFHAAPVNKQTGIEDIYSETRNIHTSPTKRPASKVLCYFRQKYLNHKRQRQRMIHKNLSNIKHHTETSKVLEDCGAMAQDLSQDYKPIQESEVYVDIALSGPVPSSAQLLSTQGIAPVLQEGDNSLEKLLPDNSSLPRNLNSNETLCKSIANMLEDHDEINNGKENIHQFSVLPRRKPFLDVSDGVSENIQNCLSSKSLNMKEKKKNYEKLAPYKYFCPNCSFKTKRESHYKRHQKLHKQISQVFSCDICNFTCIRQGVLRRHKMTHNAVDFACDKCNYRTDHYKYLLKHKRLKHWNNNKCSYKAIRKEHFMRHVNNVHNDKRPYLCDHCGKSFKRSDALKHHTFTTHGLSAYQCQVCSKIFRTQAQLNTHLAVHSNIRAFLCEVCGSSFKTRAAQYKHVLHIHKNPKAYSCTQCSRKFNTNYALRRHTKQHSLDNKTNCMQLLEETSGVFCENPIIDMDATPSLGMHIGSDSHMPPLTGNTLLIQDSLQLTLNDNQTAIAVQVIGVI